MKTVADYADAIMALIEEDMREWPSLRAASSFTDLHDHTDANEYMIHTNVPFDPDNKAVMNFYVDVQDEVTRRLVRRQTHAHIGYGPMLTPDGPSAYDELSYVRTVPVGVPIVVTPDPAPDMAHAYVWVCTATADDCEYFSP